MSLPGPDENLNGPMSEVVATVNQHTLLSTAGWAALFEGLVQNLSAYLAPHIPKTNSATDLDIQQRTYIHSRIGSGSPNLRTHSPDTSSLTNLRAKTPSPRPTS